jgi:neutral ceramidase
MSRYALTALLCCVLLASVPHTSIAAEWKAGVARQSITPEKPMRLSGYAGRNKPFEGKLHDLWVKVLALEDASGKRLLLLTMDLVGIDKDLSDSICKQIMEKHRLDRDAIMINVSHTHTGPIVGRNLRAMYDLSEAERGQIDAYTDLLLARTLTAATDAFSALKPARLAWGNGKAEFAVNRRTNVERNVPALMAAGQLKGPVDHDVPVLRVSATDGALLAVAFGYACHCTVLNTIQLSGDYAGFAQAKLEASHNGTVAMFVAGCGADQNPLPRRSVALAEKYGQMLADAVTATLKTELKSIDAKSSAKLSLLNLTFSEIPNQDQINVWLQDKDANRKRYAEYLNSALKDKGALPQNYPYPVQVWQLGRELTMIGLGGEVVVDYSLRLKSELPAGSTWMAGYCNDVMAYIPSVRVLKEGGYEGKDSMLFYGLPGVWSDTIEELIVAKVKELTTAVKADALK